MRHFSCEDPDIVLVGNGSEVSTLIGGSELLEKREGLKVNVVSAISEGLFREQPQDYQQHVIPLSKQIFGLTAGLPVNLLGLVGDRGKIFGLEHFGYSAPAGVLDEKFGFTAENVFERALKYLNEYKNDLETKNLTI